VDDYHVAHILVATQSTADALIAKLQSGAHFATLAREASADESKTRGGDLGWIAPGKLPAEFTDAVRPLEPGLFTAHPLHTAYGWHKLMQIRPA
jgi:peptidyl-prolyl cis-trans isomerase C